jgi:hypothetical protein
MVFLLLRKPTKNKILICCSLRLPLCPFFQSIFALLYDNDEEARRILLFKMIWKKRGENSVDGIDLVASLALQHIYSGGALF